VILRPFRHAVFYRIRRDETIVILGIVHASRDPATWQARR